MGLMGEGDETVNLVFCALLGDGKEDAVLIGNTTHETSLDETLL